MNEVNRALLIVDVQNDFVTGSLGSEYAKDVVVPNIVKLAENFDKGDIYVTLDTHEDNYLDTPEGKKLPIKHCIRNTEGWELAPEINDILDNSYVFNKIKKSHFGVSSEVLYSVFKYYDEVHICGLCTDICVIANALGFKSHDGLSIIRVIAHENCCGGTSKEAHDAAIMVMKSCQIEVV